MFLFIALPTFVGILVRGNFKKFSEQNNLRFDRAAFFLFILIVIIAILLKEIILEDTLQMLVQYRLL